MTPNQQDGEYIPVGVIPDDASFDKLDQKVAGSQAQMNDLAKANDQVSASAEKAAASIGKIGEVLDEGARMEADFIDFQQKLEVQTKSTDASVKQLTKDTADLTAAQKQAKDMLSNGSSYLGYGAEGGLIGPAEAPSGSSSSGGSMLSLRSAGRAIDQLGLPQVGRPIQQLGDIQLLTRDADQFAGALQKFSTAGELGATAAEALPGVSAGVGAVGAVAIEVAAPLAALVASLSLLKTEGEAARKPVDDYLKSFDTQNKQFAIASTATASSVEKQILQTRAQITLDQEQIQSKQAFLDKSAQQSILFRAYDEAFVHGQQEVRDSLGKTQGEVGKLAGDLGDLTSATVQAEVATDKYITQLLKSTNLDAYIEKLKQSGTPDQIKGLIADAGVTAKASKDALLDSSRKLFNSLASEDISPEARKKLTDLRDQIFTTTFTPRGGQKITGLQDTFEPALKALLDLAPSLKLKPEDITLKTTINGLVTSFDDASVSTTRLTNEVLPYVQATKDASESTKNLLDSLDKQAQGEIKIAELRRTGTAESVKAVIDSDADRIAALEKEYNALQFSGDTSEETAKRIKELNAELNRLGDESAAAAAILPEKVRKQIDELSTKYGEQTDQIATQRKTAAERDQADFDRKRLNAQVDQQKRLSQEDVDFYSSRDKKIRDFNLSQKGLEDKASAERLKDIQATGEAQRQAASDFANKIDEIDSKSKDDQLNSAAHLDARALDASLRSQKQQLDSATKTYDTEQQKKKDALDRQLADLVANTQGEEQQRAEAFRRELDDAQEQYNTKRSREVEAFNEQIRREDTERRVKLDQQAQDFKDQDAARLKSYKEQRQKLQDELLTPMETAQKKSWDKQVGIVNAAIGQFEIALRRLSSPSIDLKSPASKVTYDGSNGGRVRGHFADGGYPPLNVPVKVGERGPETAVFTQPVHIYPNGAGAGGGAVNFNFNAPLYLNGDLGSLQAYEQVKGLMHRAYTEMRGS
jgi:hypothetical protein